MSQSRTNIVIIPGPSISNDNRKNYNYEHYGELQNGGDYVINNIPGTNNKIPSTLK